VRLAQWISVSEIPVTGDTIMRTIVKLAFASFALAGAWGFSGAAWADDPVKEPVTRQGEAKVAISHVFRTGDIIGLA